MKLINFKFINKINMSQINEKIIKLPSNRYKNNYKDEWDENDSLLKEGGNKYKKDEKYMSCCGEGGCCECCSNCCSNECIIISFGILIIVDFFIQSIKWISIMLSPYF